MPRKGFSRIASRTHASRPWAASSDMQSPIAPWPGKTTRSAAATRAGSAVTRTSTASPPTYRTAFSTERRLPIPKSMIATCCTASVSG